STNPPLFQGHAPAQWDPYVIVLCVASLLCVCFGFLGLEYSVGLPSPPTSPPSQINHSSFPEHALPPALPRAPDHADGVLRAVQLPAPLRASLRRVRCCRDDHLPAH